MSVSLERAQSTLARGSARRGCPTGKPIQRLFQERLPTITISPNSVHLVVAEIVHSYTFWIVTLNEAIKRARYGGCISVTQLSRNIALALTFKPAFRDPREVVIAIDIDAHCASRLADDYSPIQAHPRFSLLFARRAAAVSASSSSRQIASD